MNIVYLLIQNKLINLNIYLFILMYVYHCDYM